MDTPTCASWVLDKSELPDTYSCYFYDKKAQQLLSQLTPGDSQMYLWMDRECWNCGIGNDITGASTTSWPTSTGTTLTNTPTLPPTALSNSCTKANPYLRPNPTYTPVCQGSPTALPSHLAVVTGIPAPVQPDYSLTSAYGKCAGVCAVTPGCKAFVLDVGDRFGYASDPTTTFTCYLYDMFAQDYTPYAPFSLYWTHKLWLDSTCFECNNGQDVSTTVSEPTITPPPVVRSIAAPRPGERTCEGVNNGLDTMCDYSGLPLPTGRPPLVVATGIPPPPNRRYDDDDQTSACAAVCADTVGCTAWALERTSDDWKCYVLGNLDPQKYYEEVEFLSEDDLDYDVIDKYLWNDARCYSCAPGSTTSSAPSTVATTTSDSSYTTDSSTIVTSTTDSGTTDTGTTATSTSFSVTSETTTGTITSAPPIPTRSAPALGDRNCQLTGDEQYTVCDASGLPPPATSVWRPIAVATGIPATTARYAEEQYKTCAAVCQDNPDCTAWQLRRAPAADWTCTLYGSGFDLMQYSNSLPDDWDYTEAGRLVWTDRTCYICDAVDSSSTTTTWSDSTTGWTTTTSGMDDMSWSPTTSSSATITSAPSAHTTSALPLGQRSCAEVPDAEAIFPSVLCSISGRPLPPTASVQPLLVATGLPSALQRYDDEQQVHDCASMCQDTLGCYSWAIDRDIWPARAESWTCYLYGLDFSLKTYWFSQFDRDAPEWDTVDRYLWSSRPCYACSDPVAVDNTSSTVTTTAEPSTTTTWSSSTGYDEATSTTSSATTSSNTVPPTPVCTRAAVPATDDGPACSVRGFRLQQSYSLHAYGGAGNNQTVESCAGFCWSLNQVQGGGTCGSSFWDSATRGCYIWTAGVWDALGEDAPAGRAYQRNVMDDAACWGCWGTPDDVLGAGRG